MLIVSWNPITCYFCNGKMMLVILTQIVNSVNYIFGFPSVILRVKRDKIEIFSSVLEMFDKFDDDTTNAKVLQTFRVRLSHTQISMQM